MERVMKQDSRAKEYDRAAQPDACSSDYQGRIKLFGAPR